jgi:hypothetical protein
MKGGIRRMEHEGMAERKGGGGRRRRRKEGRKGLQKGIEGSEVKERS